MNNRRWIATLSLINAFVAFYLHLWKLGKTGKIACAIGGHGCEYIMTSAYSYFMHKDVALIGTWGYSALFIVAVIAGLDQLANKKWPTLLLMLFIWPAFLFTARLKYYEWFVLHGFCQWCFVNVVIVIACAVLVTRDWRRVRTAAAAAAT